MKIKAVSSFAILNKVEKLRQGTKMEKIVGNILAKAISPKIKLTNEQLAQLKALKKPDDDVISKKKIVHVSKNAMSRELEDGPKNGLSSFMAQYADKIRRA